MGENRMSNAFNSQILEEKLSKVNNSQQSIETLSHWCIFHRKKAKQVVETWEKLFNGSLKEKRVPFLYLANDILQNSRRKGSEYVNEFWKVLPRALKSVYENGDDHGKNVISRLVDIWDERKVFGSRGRGLKDDILGKDAPPSLSESNGTSSHPIKIVKKDAHSVRIKLAVGGMPEKIVTAYQSILDEHFSEDTALNKCKSAISHIGKMEKDVDDACAQGSPNKSHLLNEIQEQETNLKQSVEQLGNVEATRAALIQQLKEALQEQKSKMELIRTQLQAARVGTEHATTLKQRLISVSRSGPSIIQPITSHSSELTPVAESSLPVPPSSTPPQPPQPVTCMASSLTTAEEENKRAAAAVAAKLAASTSSAQMLTSVLSSLVAEEAASMGAALNPASFTANPPLLPMEKRPKLEKPVSGTDMANAYVGQNQQQQMAPIPVGLPPSSASLQLSPQFAPPPPPLPPPRLPSMQQFTPTAGVMVGLPPFGFGSNVVPPPPPLSAHPLMGLATPGVPQPPQPPKQQQQTQQQQQPATTGYYQASGMGFYGQPQTAPLVPRQ